ncbi:MAG TPA: F0F1 ATP synthase subunit B [Solirubrobacteraceae bacterium]|jgi:F-type H+-transporting ATPase subunit b|nr:F0F1 ATP synthase subunit B [Solirubrobacteraceae bacterium]
MLIAADSSSNNFLIKPNVGLMVWILVVFAISLAVLVKWVFPRITAALDDRANAINTEIDTATATREEAEKVLSEYRERLKEARDQADEIVQRARDAAKSHEAESTEAARERARELVERAERDIEAATARALQEIRNQVADLTILATEKVTRKTLTGEDQRRLVEEAIGEIDLSSLSSSN